MAWIWDRIRGIGGNRDEATGKREEYGGEDPGAAEEQYLADGGGLGFGPGGGGVAGGEAAEVARDDLAELEPPEDPAP